MPKQNATPHVHEGNPFGFHEELVPVDQIRKHEANPRKISKKARNELKKSLGKFGLIDKPILNKDYGLIAGHQRFDILVSAGWKQIPCMVPDIELSQDDVNELLIRHNKNTGEWDPAALVNFDPTQLLSWGFSAGELPKELTDGLGGLDEDDEPPTFPLVPKFSEKYNFVIIIAKNDVETTFLENFFKLDNVKEYNSSVVGLGRVVTFERFQEIVLPTSKKAKG